MPDQQRKLVFFLGAGASFAAGATATVQRGAKVAIPTQANFWRTFLRFCAHRDNEDKIVSFLFRYFLGYARAPSRYDRAERRSCFDGIDVEEVFTFLSERVQAPGTSPQLRTSCVEVWEALLEEMPSVFSRFTSNSATRQTYRDLLKNQIRSHDRIVSFNYDSVFEDSLPRNQAWHYEVIEEKPRSLRVLKPHGSWNWESGSKIVVSDNPERAVIVAPTHLKFIRPGARDGSDDEASAGYLDQSPQIQEIWSVMEGEMRVAKALVFIGYSFPAGDLYFSSVLRAVLASRGSAPKVVIVNPDALAIQNRLISRFALNEVAKYFDLETFSLTTRAEVLAIARANR